MPFVEYHIKIIILSLINSLIVAATNVIASMFMNNSHTSSNAPAAGAQANHNSLFMIPAPVLIGLRISLLLGVIISYIINMTTEKTSLAVSKINKARLLADKQKDALKLTQEVFDKIKVSYNGIVSSHNRYPGYTSQYLIWLLSVYMQTRCTVHNLSTHRPTTVRGSCQDFTRFTDATISLICSQSLTGLAAQS